MVSLKQSRNAQSGLSLIVTLVIAAGASVLIAGVLYYTSTQSNLTRRINQYDSSVAAAVAATEKVVTRITRDFHVGGDTHVRNNLAAYRGLVPNTEDLLANLNLLQPVTELLGAADSSYSVRPVWSKYEFADPQGQVNQTHIEAVSDWAFRDLGAKFSGLKGYATDYRIIANVREKDRGYHIVSAVRQDVQVAAIPLCQFQFYYVPDMELNPTTPGMRLNGRLHCNGNIYLQPNVDLSFQGHVTASRRILHSKHPADPVPRGQARISYLAERETGLNTVNLSIGTNAGPLELRQILEAPTGSESPGSLLAQERFYNKADLIVVVSNDVVTGRSGSYNSGSVNVSWLESRGIVTRNAQGFYDARECREMKVTDIDMGRLLANYADLERVLGRPPRTVWIVDLGDDGKGKKDKDKDKDDDWGDSDEDHDKGKGNDKDKDIDAQGAAPILGGLLQGATTPLGAIRILNAQTLPAVGFSLVTPNPIYVQGSFNVGSAPALLAGDAVTILSADWVDLNGAKTLSSRIARDTTVNAAVITGVVPTGSGGYSGGAENALRLLEDWNGKTLTFSGSIAVIFYSKVADAPWGGPEVYAPPIRAWSYDVQLADATRTPHSMPMARTVFRSDWTLIKPHSKL